MSQVQRALWVIAGSICLLLGVIGIFLPLLPTTPFILLTAICWARGSTKFYDWLVSHRVFGKMVRDWESQSKVALDHYDEWNDFAFCFLSFRFALVGKANDGVDRYCGVAVDLVFSKYCEV